MIRNLKWYHLGGVLYLVGNVGAPVVLGQMVLLSCATS